MSSASSFISFPAGSQFFSLFTLHIYLHAYTVSSIFLPSHPSVRSPLPFLICSRIFLRAPSHHSSRFLLDHFLWTPSLSFFILTLLRCFTQLKHHFQFPLMTDPWRTSQIHWHSLALCAVSYTTLFGMNLGQTEIDLTEARGAVIPRVLPRCSQRHDDLWLDIYVICS